MFQPHVDQLTGKTFYHNGDYNFSDPRWYAAVRPLRTSLSQRIDIPEDIICPLRQRLFHHIDTVCYLGRLYDASLDFSGHDTSKLYDEMEDAAYIHMAKHQRNNLTVYYDDAFEDAASSDKSHVNPDMSWAVKGAIKHHKIVEPHHPEFYTVIPTNPYEYDPARASVDIKQMPEFRLLESVADWHSVSLEQNIMGNGIKYGDTLAFYTNKALVKYRYTAAQQKMIVDFIKFLNAHCDRNAVRDIWTGRTLSAAAQEFYDIQSKLVQNRKAALSAQKF